MCAVLFSVGKAVAESAFQFLIVNGGIFGTLGQSVLDQTVSGLIEKGENELSKWRGRFEYRFEQAVGDSLRILCADRDETAFIEKNLEILFTSVSKNPLPLSAFYDVEKLYMELKKRYEAVNGELSDEENKKFCQVLWGVTPVFLEAKKNAGSYIPELMQENHENILQIRQGTEQILQRIDELQNTGEDERVKPESSVQKFYRLWEQSRQASVEGGDHELDAHGQLLVFLNEEIQSGTFDDLCVALPDAEEVANAPLPEYMCAGSHDHLPLFYAQALVWNAQARANRPGDRKRKLLDSSFVQKQIGQAENIIKVCGIDNGIDPNESGTGERFCRRLVYEIGEVRSGLPCTGQAPAIKVNQNDDALAVFEPVFSGGFDSVTGQDPNKLNDLELNIFQLAASGKTILLQGPQILDNLNTLRLLHTIDFEMLCDMGIVAFSSYGNIKSTKDFIISRLKNSDFKFSSFPEYDDQNIGLSLREAVLYGLERNLPFQRIVGRIPQHLRERMELVYDGYRIAGECFREADILKYHQNPKIRTTKFHLLAPGNHMSAYGLPDILHKKIEELEEDQRLVPIEKRDVQLRQFRELESRGQKPAQEGRRCKYRSDYDHMIDGLKENGEFEDEVLELFRRLVHSCYLFYNGKLSCEKVILPMSDPELCVHHRNQELQQSIFKVDYAYKRYKRMSVAEQNVVGWSNIAECVLNAREVAVDPSVPLEDKAMMMHRATGLVYATALDQTPNVTMMSMKTSQGEQIDVSDQAFDTDTVCGNDTQEYYQTPIEPAKEA